MASTRKPRSGNRADAATATARWYVFCVVALAVFVTCLLVCRQPVDGHIARTTLLQRGLVRQSADHAASAAANRASQAKAVAATLRDRDLLGRVVHQTGLARGARISEDLATQWIETRLRVNVQERETHSGEFLITIEHAGETKRDALAVVEALSSEYVQAQLKNLSATRCRRCEKAQAAVEQAAIALQTARAELETFSATHVRQLHELGFVDAVDATSPIGPSANEPISGANVSDGELRQRLEILRAAYQELAGGSGPQQAAQDLAWQIKQLEKQLREGESGTSRETTHTSQSTDALAGKFRLLKAVADGAQRRWEETVQTEKQTRQRYRDKSARNVEVVQAAQIAQRLGGGVSRGTLLFAGLLALAAGGLATWRAQVQASGEVLVNLEQVERLGVPVLAALATGDGPHIPSPQIQVRPLVAWITFGCEILLAAILLVLLVLSLLNAQIAWTIIHDPLQGLLDGVGLLAAG